MSELQKQASDPSKSVFVSASAGTGKTKILTDRVIKLLISGAALSEILCITYTKVAANEMRERLMHKFAYFAKIPDHILKNELSILMDRDVNNDELIRAKSLYLQILTTRCEINNYTIHSLCEKIIRSSSLDISINPSFKLIDDIAESLISKKIIKNIFSNEKYKNITDFFLINCHEETISKIITAIKSDKNKFKNYFQILQISSSTFQNFVQLTKANDILSDVYDNIALSFNATKTELKKIFFTDTGLERKNIASISEDYISKELYYLLKNDKNIQNKLKEYQSEIVLLVEHANNENIENYSNLICFFAFIFLTEYDKYKAEHLLLDFDDLIFETIKINSNLQKIDKNIKHLLVDEAQDTNPEQWQIINQILDSFYHSKKTSSSIFIVGDPKQSIFSFQGANIKYFNDVNKDIELKSIMYEKEFLNIELEYSYRSSKTIITFVNRLFAYIKYNFSNLFKINNPDILAFRNSLGTVEIWPLIKKNENPDVDNEHKIILASKIAIFIKNQIKSGRILPSTNKAICDGDFMILIKKRDDFAHELLNQLKIHKLNIDSMDQIILQNNIAILDLIAIGKFVLSPFDDLNLAGLLKSPIISIREEELYLISRNRGNLSIWEYLNNMEHNCLNILNKLIEIYKITSLLNFFTIILDYFSLRHFIENSENKEAINELISISRNYAQNIDNSLQSFIVYFENNEFKVKRDLDNKNKIRIMTIHGSKGLQAPIVIVVDDTKLSLSSEMFFWHEEKLYASRSFHRSSYFQNILDLNKQKTIEEYIRLLYVALTRAEDHLIICGYSSLKNTQDKSWHNLIYKSMESYSVLKPNGVMIYGEEHEYNSTIINEEKIIEIENNSIDNIWNIDNNIFDKFINKTINLSSKSPLISSSYKEYGIVFHKILEDTIKLDDLSLLKKHPLIKSLNSFFQKKIYNNIEKLIIDLNFLDLRKQEIKLEFEIGINYHDVIKIVRIDLLAITDDIITIVDYKTDASPPNDSSLIPTSYIDQLNLYRHIVGNIYKNHKIICKILWLETAKFNEI
jgi:ATP-dependent helicase/nuclease subunit A